MKIQDFSNYRAPKDWEQTQIQAYVHANLVKEQPNYPFLLMKTLDLAENHVLYELCPKTNIEKGDHITCV